MAGIPPFSGLRITSLFFADDIVLLGSSPNKLQHDLGGSQLSVIFPTWKTMQKVLVEVQPNLVFPINVSILVMLALHTCAIGEQKDLSTFFSLTKIST